jgi:hypothetical protein
LLIAGFGGVIVEMSRQPYDARLHWVVSVSVTMSHWRWESIPPPMLALREIASGVIEIGISVG